MNPTSRPTDREIREAFVRRAQASPTHDLIDRIHQETRTVKQNRPLLVLPAVGDGPQTARIAWVAALAILVALVGVLVLVGNRPANDLSVVPPSPSATAQPSAEPSASADASPSVQPSAAPSEAVPSSPPPADLNRGIATVLVDSLRVRSNPGVTTDSKLQTPLLGTGQSVYVVDGPVDSDGYTWYAVAPREADGSLTPSLPKGWVSSASRQGEPWLSSIEPAPCPIAPPTVDALIALADGSACFGDAELTLLAIPAAIEVDGGWCFPIEEIPDCLAEPTWLLYPGFPVYAAGWPDYGSLYFAAAAPDAALAEWDGLEATFRITGHFADPATATCRVYDSVTDKPLVMTPEEVVAICRRTFVVTKSELVGR